MILLVFAPQDTPSAYADLRQSIALVSDYVLIPSLAIALVSGLLASQIRASTETDRAADRRGCDVLTYHTSEAIRESCCL